MSVDRVDTRLIEATNAISDRGTYVILVSGQSRGEYRWPKVQITIDPGPDAGTVLGDEMSPDLAVTLGRFLCDITPGGDNPVSWPAGRLGRALLEAGVKCLAETEPGEATE